MAQLNNLIVTGASRFLNTINGNITNASTAGYASSVSWGNVGGRPSTYPPTIGNAATQAAAGTHTHTLTIATDSGTNQLTMAANTKYKITAGGNTYIFTTPPDNNTTYATFSTSANGLVPKPASAATTSYLNSSGTWTTPTNSTYALAEGTANGTVKWTSGGSTSNVAVHGLGSAAYAASTSFIASTLKGANNGVAELGSDGKVPTAQLPSYVDDVVEGASTASFPTTGETGKIYVALDTNLTYRWSGTAYVEISPSLALGETSATAYRGDRGKIAYDHSQTAHAPSNAQANQNAFSNVKVGSTTVAADTTTDTIELAAGSNVTLTPDATNDKITIAATNTTYTANNGVGISGNTFYNSGVRAVSQGTTNGTINVNTNGTTADVSVKGLAALAYKSSLGKADVGLGNVANVDQSKAIKSITRSGLTFTATALDNTTFSFTQQDTNTDTKVTSEANHYSPNASTASELSADATGATASWSIDVVKGVKIQRDSKGHVTGVTVTSGKIPANPNTDTKVTAVGNHYTPTTNNASSVSVDASGGSDATPGTTQLVTGVTLKRDAAYHVTGLEVKSIKLPTYPTNTDHLYYAGTGLNAASTSGNNTTFALATTGTAGTYGPSANVTGNDGATISVPQITTDSYGRVTAVTNRTYTSKNTNTTYAFTNNAPTLAWSTASTIGTVGGVALTVKMPANPNTNTTYAAMSVAEGTAGTATTSRAMTAANLKGILGGSTFIYGYAPCVGADFDFGELTSTGETYVN